MRTTSYLQDPKSSNSFQYIWRVIRHKGVWLSKREAFQTGQVKVNLQLKKT